MTDAALARDVKMVKDAGFVDEVLSLEKKGRQELPHRRRNPGRYDPESVSWKP